MSKRHIHIEHDQFQCDICGNRTLEPENERWFEVNQEGHACLGCGHQLHEIFKKLGIEHTFVCKQYSDDPAMGTITFAANANQQ